MQTARDQPPAGILADVTNVGRIGDGGANGDERRRHLTQFPDRHHRVPDPTQSNHRPSDVGAALSVTPRLVLAQERCQAVRSATETELVKGERFMVSGPMRLEAPKQTDGHRIRAFRRPSYGYVVVV
jgi:hypothetical protein